MQAIAPASATGLLYWPARYMFSIAISSYWQLRLRRLFPSSIAIGRGAVGAHLCLLWGAAPAFVGVATGELLDTLTPVVLVSSLWGLDGQPYAPVHQQHWTPT